MRLIVTADLHYNHARSKAGAIDLIDEMNRAGGDVLLVIGDAAAADGDDLEQCLSKFKSAGPKLFVAGNHELWTRGPDSYELYHQVLPRRIRDLGWQWIEAEPFVADGLAIVGSIGWYDYSFAQHSLAIPERFYEQKVSPGAAERFPELAYLLEGSDISAQSREVVARWNDGKFVKLQRDDRTFLEELITRLDRNLAAVQDSDRIIAAIHHLPFRELLPPSRGSQWDFAKAYLGSEKIGQCLQRYKQVTHVLCGHSHWPAEAQIGQIQAVNIGSGYRRKIFRTFDL